MNRVVIVTGGGRGIGAATSSVLAAKGYSVCVNYISNAKSAQSLVNEITKSGGEVFSFKADVRVENDVVALFDAAEKEFGRVSYLVNNVGIVYPQSTCAEIQLERFQQMLLANVTSCFLCSREFIRRNPPYGAIVNVSSAASRTGAPFEYVDYAASKGAMDSFTKGLSLELASKGIRVNAVRPGFIYTQLHADGGEPNRVNRLAPHIPLGRGGEPEEVANAIAWLLSDEASYVTGSFVDIAGGK